MLPGALDANLLLLPPTCRVCAVSELEFRRREFFFFFMMGYPLLGSHISQAYSQGRAGWVSRGCLQRSVGSQGSSAELDGITSHVRLENRIGWGIGSLLRCTNGRSAFEGYRGTRCRTLTPLSHRLKCPRRSASDVDRSFAAWDTGRSLSLGTVRFRTWWAAALFAFAWNSSLSYLVSRSFIFFLRGWTDDCTLFFCACGPYLVKSAGRGWLWSRAQVLTSASYSVFR